MFDFWKLIPKESILSGVFTLFLSAFVSFLSIPIVVKICKAKSLTDKPNGRTSHEGSIPSLGGVAIFASVLMGSTLLMPPNQVSDPLRYIMAAIFLMFFVGLSDDIIDISWKKKLSIEIIASLILIVLGNFRFTSLFGFAGIHDIPMWASIILTLIVFIGIINAFNLIDGIDGLAAGTGILTSFAMGVWLFGLGEYGMAILALSLTGSLFPFIYFNIYGKKNKIFMGDTGSLLIGILMALFAVTICGKELPLTHPLYMKAAPSVLIAILIYPLFDMIRVFTIRIFNGKNPFLADRLHIHHLFLAVGYTHRRTTLFILMFNIYAIIWALIFRNSPILFLGLSLLANCIIGVYVIQKLGEHRTHKVKQEKAGKHQ